MSHDHAQLAESVIAVPPLARRPDWTLDATENRKIIDYLRAGGVTTILYGGNAVLYHARLTEYENLLDMIAPATEAGTWVIPSIGPGFGTMLDQAEILRNYPFPTVMVLPTRDIVTAKGIAIGLRRLVDNLGRPIVLYLKQDDILDVGTIGRLVDEGIVSWIKYGITRNDPGQDNYLRSLVDAVDRTMIVSGIGEQPAIIHLRDFGLAGFTSGCVCVAPRLSMALLRHLAAKDYVQADRLRRIFTPLEDLRNAIHPVRVLHAAVSLAQIANTGPIMPFLDEVTHEPRAEIARAVHELLKSERAVP